MSPKKQIKILLIEDNLGDAELIRTLLMDENGADFYISRSITLSSAIKLLESEPFDIILSDLGLPDSQGIETFLKVHTLYPSVPVIVLTGLTDEELAIKAVKNGAQDYLVKGQAESGLLVRSIRYSIERHKLLTQLENSLKEIKTLRGLIPMCAGAERYAMTRVTGARWKPILKKTPTPLLLTAFALNV